MFPCDILFLFIFYFSYIATLFFTPGCNYSLIFLTLFIYSLFIYCTYMSTQQTWSFVAYAFTKLHLRWWCASELVIAIRFSIHVTNNLATPKLKVPSKGLLGILMLIWRLAYSTGHSATNLLVFRPSQSYGLPKKNYGSRVCI